MAFYYVKSGGTATGDAGRAATGRTGSFASMGASAYYDNISDGITVPTTSPVAGDSLYVSDAHSHSYSSDPTITGEDTIGAVKVISVSDTNADAYSAGASESRGSGGDILLAEGLYFSGISFTLGDDLTLLTDARVTFEDFTHTFEGSVSRLNPNGDGSSLIMKNGVINTTLGSAWGSVILLTNGCFVHFVNVSITETNGITNLFEQGFNSGGGTALFEGCDFSVITGTILASIGSNTQADDLINVELHGCKLNASVSAADETFAKESQKISLFNSSSNSDAAEYQFFQRSFGGDLEDQDDSGIHRDESTAFPSGTKVSVKVTTNSVTAIENPFTFDLPARFAALSSASTDTIRIYFAVSNATTLTDINCWAELVYPDGTNKQTFNYITNRNTNIIDASPTTHTDDSGSSTWLDGVSGLASHNEYRMDLDSSSDAGADSVPIIRIYITEPSVTIYFDTTVDVVA